MDSLEQQVKHLREANARLEREVLRLSALLNACNEGIALLGAQGNVLFVNRAAKLALGDPETLAISANPFHDRSRPDLQQRILRHCNSFNAPTANSAIHRIALLDELCFVARLAPVTSPPPVDTALRVLQPLNDALPVGITVWRYDGDATRGTGDFTVVYSNGEAATVTGLPLSPGRRLSNLVVDATGIAAFFGEIATLRRAAFLERFCVDNGPAFSVKAFPLPESCVGVIFQRLELAAPAPAGTARGPGDITALQRLASEANVAYAIVEHISDEPRVVHVNAELEQLIGRPVGSHELIGQNVLLWLSPEESAKNERFRLRTALAHQTEAVVDEVDIVRVDGFRVPCTVTLVCLVARTTPSSDRTGTPILDSSAVPRFLSLVVFRPTRGRPGKHENAADPSAYDTPNMFEPRHYRLCFDNFNLILVAFRRGVDGRYQLVAANKLGRCYWQPDIGAGSDTGYPIGQYFDELFPQLATSGFLRLYDDILESRRPRFMGVTRFEGKTGFREGWYASKAFALDEDVLVIANEEIPDVSSARLPPVEDPLSSSPPAATATTAFSSATTTTTTTSSLLTATRVTNNRHSNITYEGVLAIRRDANAPPSAAPLYSTLFEHLLYPPSRSSAALSRLVQPMPTIDSPLLSRIMSRRIEDTTHKHHKRPLSDAAAPNELTTSRNVRQKNETGMPVVPLAERTHGINMSLGLSSRSTVGAAVTDDPRAVEIDVDTESELDQVQMLQDVFEHPLVGVSVASPKGRYIKVNEAFCQLTGYSSTELTASGPMWPQITHPQDVENSKGIIRQMTAGEYPTLYVVKRYVHKHGHLIKALAATYLKRNIAGQPHYFITHLIDLSKLRMLFPEEFGILFAGAFTASGIASAIVNGVGITAQVSHSNKAFCELFGFSDTSEVVSLPFSALFVQRDDANKILPSAGQTPTAIGVRWNVVCCQHRMRGVLWCMAIASPITASSLSIATSERFIVQFLHVEGVQRILHMVGGSATSTTR